MIRLMVPPLPAVSRPSKMTISWSLWWMIHSCIRTNSNCRRSSSLSPSARVSVRVFTSASPDGSRVWTCACFVMMYPSEHEPSLTIRLRPGGHTRDRLRGGREPHVAAEVERNAEAVDDDGIEVGVAAQGAGSAVLQAGAGHAGRRDAGFVGAYHDGHLG